MVISLYSHFLRHPVNLKSVCICRCEMMSTGRLVVLMTTVAVLSVISTADGRLYSRLLTFPSIVDCDRPIH